MHAVIRHYHFNPEDGQKIDQLIREGFVPLIKKQRASFVIIGWIQVQGKVHR